MGSGGLTHIQILIMNGTLIGSLERRVKHIKIKTLHSSGHSVPDKELAVFAFSFLR